MDFGPQKGDVLEIRIEDIGTKCGAQGIILDSGYGPKVVHIDIDDNTLDRGDGVYVKITEWNKSHCRATITDPPEDEEETSYYEKSRDKKIEWEGTEQKLEGSSEKGKKVFSEGDQTGDKNDLLGGHL